MTVKLSIPNSPSWESSTYVSLCEAPKSHRWRTLISHILQYPNIPLQPDSETMQEFQKKFSQTIQLWKTSCRHSFPCPNGRQTLSKKQRKQPSGKSFGQSLCGQCMLNHYVSQKREEMNTIKSEEISEWYFATGNESDSDIYDKMELQLSPLGTLKFTDSYLKTLQTGIDASSAA